MTATVSPLRTRYFCSQCGGETTPNPAHPSIDPRYAIADCRDCGHMRDDQLVPALVQAVAHEGRAHELAQAYKAARLARLHEGHKASGKMARGCAGCERDKADL